MEDKIMTLHPEGKQGVNISKAKYDQMRAAILAGLEAHDEITFSDLRKVVEDHFGDSFDGSVGWYFTSVKLDMEARNELMRVPKTSPQLLRLVR